MKLCVLAATVLFIFAGVAFGQTGILSLQEGKSAVGLGYQWYNPSEKSEQNTGAQNIRGCFDWQFNRFLKMSFIPGVAFWDTDILGRRQTFPPAASLARSTPMPQETRAFVVRGSLLQRVDN